MFRLDQLLRADTIVRDVKRQYPATLPVCEELGFRPACDNGDIETTARKNGLRSRDVAGALNRAIFLPKTETEK